MANTKKTPQKHRGESDDYIGGCAHKHCQLNQWTEEAMAAAIIDYNQLCGQLGAGNVSISSVAHQHNIPTMTFWKRYSKPKTFLFSICVAPSLTVSCCVLSACLVCTFCFQDSRMCCGDQPLLRRKRSLQGLVSR